MKVAIHTQPESGRRWLDTYRHQRPHVVCVLGFTATALVPGISAAGLTPADRRYTALADGEFLALGVQPSYRYPLPPLVAGASPAVITRAIVAGLDLPVTIFNAGLLEPPSFAAVDLGGQPADCLSTGRAMSLELVEHLWRQGWDWGDRLGRQHPYVILGECVVGGTSTAQAVLAALGYDVVGRVNSSHPQCNHHQKQQLVAQGLGGLTGSEDPAQIVAAVGDPMQVVVAAMALGASRRGGVLLAGGTQMLAVYALARAWSQKFDLTYSAPAIAIGTTGWVTDDASADAVGLARQIPEACLLSAQLHFGTSRFPQFQVYDRGYVKEGVGAGACAIAAHLYQGWQNEEILAHTETLWAAYLDSCSRA